MPAYDALARWEARLGLENKWFGAFLREFLKGAAERFNSPKTRFGDPAARAQHPETRLRASGFFLRAGFTNSHVIVVRIGGPSPFPSHIFRDAERGNRFHALWHRTLIFYKPSNRHARPKFKIPRRSCAAQ
jgi:hypothetical protein